MVILELALIVGGISFCAGLAALLADYIKS